MSKAAKLFKTGDKVKLPDDSKAEIRETFSAQLITAENGDGKEVRFDNLAFRVHKKKIYHRLALDEDTRKEHAGDDPITISKGDTLRLKNKVKATVKEVRKVQAAKVVKVGGARARGKVIFATDFERNKKGKIVPKTDD